MQTKQVNPYADLVVVCLSDRCYSRELVCDDNVLVGVLGGEPKVVQSDRTHYCGAGDTLLLRRWQSVTLLKYPKDSTAYQAVVLKMPPALWRAYYAENAPALAPVRPAAPGPRLLPRSPLLQILSASLLPYLTPE